MKPKGSESEDGEEIDVGLLEYLEEIIGSD